LKKPRRPRSSGPGKLSARAGRMARSALDDGVRSRASVKRGWHVMRHPGRALPLDPVLAGSILIPCDGRARPAKSSSEPSLRAHNGPGQRVRGRFHRGRSVVCC
jgi:hypothetical protein